MQLKHDVVDKYSVAVNDHISHCIHRIIEMSMTFVTTMMKTNNQGTNLLEVQSDANAVFLSVSQIT